MEGPVDPRFSEMMNAAMAALDEAFNAGLKGNEKAVGLVLLVFPYGASDGKANYISNGANRKAMTAMFRETAARFEG